MSLWGTFAERLAESFPVVAFDPRGVGKSSDPPLLHSTKTMARDAVSVLDELGIRRAHVFGLSLGGMVASWVAVDFPERVSRLVLASTLPSASGLSCRGLRKLAKMSKDLFRPGEWAELGLVHDVLSREFLRDHPERVAAIEALVRAEPTSHRNLAVLLLAGARHDVAGCLGRVKADSLLLLGSRDRIAGLKAEIELLRAIPHAALEVVPGAGHDVTLEAPERTADRVLAFLEGRLLSARFPGARERSAKRLA